MNVWASTICRTVLAVLACIMTGSPFAAASDEQASLELFEKHIRPALVDHCIRCHGPDKQQGGLRLDNREGWVEGGDSGAAIVAGDRESLLLQAINYDDVSLEMPPRGRLPQKTIDAFYEWVETGAADPRGVIESGTESKAIVPPTVEEGREFWSFQPIRRPNVPAVDDPWPNTDIDRFVLDGLVANGLSPNPRASRVALLRRLYFDLVGLPPTPDQIESFLNDSSPDAYESLVERLLDSKHFGERWGRHWLDVVRFAESSGGGRTLLFPEAWRYRDYVIESFNRDVPYDRFLVEQIAGDLLEHDDLQQRARNLTATAFLLLGPINYEMQDKAVLEMDIVDEQLDTIGKALMGMTIGCARCHDHKFDPIPTTDYYAMAGILKSTQSVVHSNVSKWNTMDLPLDSDQQLAYEQTQQRLKELQGELKEKTTAFVAAGGKEKGAEPPKSIPVGLIDGIVVDDGDAELIGKWKSSTSVSGYVGANYIHDENERNGEKRIVYRPDIPSAGRYEVLVSFTASSNRSTRVPVHVNHGGGSKTVRINQRKRPRIEGGFESVGKFRFEAGPSEIVISNEGATDGVVIADAIVMVPVDRKQKRLLREAVVSDDSDSPNVALVAMLQREIDGLNGKIQRLRKSLPKTDAVMATTDSAAAADIHVAIRGQTHQKGDLVPRGVMSVASATPFPIISDGQSGRKELASWIADAQHPLTARVMANRIWYWLMGRGIVSTVDNFGQMGQPPSHPELLDHLASEFVRNGWSVKDLIRQIVLSKTYQMSSEVDKTSFHVDPGNRLYWRKDRKRLRAEDIRDALLHVSGQLDTRYGGPNIREGTKIEYGYQFTSTRRSVYVPVFRNNLPEVFEVFDFADPNTQAGSRGESAVASQALWMMNHPSVVERTKQAARALLELSFENDERRIRHVYQQVLSRLPSEAEMAVAVELVVPSSKAEASSNAELAQRYGMLYRVLFQCLDFRFLN